MRELETLAYFVPLLLWIIWISSWPILSPFNEDAIDIGILPKCDFYLTFGQTPFIFNIFAYDNVWIILLAAIPYTIHFLLPFVFGIFLAVETYIKTKGCKTAIRWKICAFFWTFGVANLMGVFIQWLFPTAPPWWYYITPSHIAEIPGNPSVFVLVDEYFGNTFFTNLYSKSTIVYGSFPSLHAAWPLIACYFTLNKRQMWRRVVWCIYLFWIWWAAIYSRHHFMVDVLGGIIISAIAIAIHRRFLVKPVCKLRRQSGVVEGIDDPKPTPISSYIYFHNCSNKVTTVSQLYKDL